MSEFSAEVQAQAASAIMRSLMDEQDRARRLRAALEEIVRVLGTWEGGVPVEVYSIAEDALDADNIHAGPSAPARQ